MRHGVYLHVDICYLASLRFGHCLRVAESSYKITKGVTVLRRSVRDRGAVADPDAFVESPQVVLVTEFQARRSTMLGKLLADHSLVEDSAIEAILWSQPEERIGQELVKAGLLTELQVTEALAEQFGTVAVDLTRVVLDKEAAEQLPADRARACDALTSIVPVRLVSRPLFLVLVPSAAPQLSRLRLAVYSLFPLPFALPYLPLSSRAPPLLHPSPSH